MAEEKILCPKCYSDRLTTDKEGFSAGKAVVGGLLLGPLGLGAGFLGAKKLKIYCIACGHKFKPGEHATRPPTQKEKYEGTTWAIITFAGLAVWILVGWLLGKVPAFQSHHMAGWIGFIAAIALSIYIFRIRKSAKK